MSAADVDDKEVVTPEDTEKDEGQTEAVSQFLGMSDEEIMKMPPPTATAVAPASKEADKVATKEEVATDDDKGEDKAEAAGEAKAADAKADAGEKEVKAEPKEPAKDVVKEEKVADKVEVKDPTKEAAKEEKTETPKQEEVKVDFEAEYKRLLTPFKANGRDIQVENVDDAIALMQMGANYNKKMAALKPNMKLMKMLENNGFLSEEKIGFLIDLGKKDPGAIQKLVKDSGMDPMDLDAEKAKTYKPTAYAVDEREIELDTVLDELKDSPAYTRTLDVVSNKWDAASKQVISSTPQLLKVINDHVASGIYDLINTEVERGRMLGRLSGLSDIEAYRQVGDAIQARGGFAQIGQAKSEPKAAAAPVIVEPKPKKVEDDKLKDKKRAASATQPAAAGAATTDFNPLALSDEEFSKLGNPKFLMSK